MDEARDHIELSIVVPVYGCADCIAVLVERLAAAARQTTTRFEIVLVDDRSVDGGWERIAELAGEHPEIRAFRLSRNFGQQTAILAGMSKARGSWTTVLDCDLQDPPELIPELFAKAQAGYDVVYGVRRRTGTPWFRRHLASLYAVVMNLITHAQIDPGHSAFTMMSRRVVDAYVEMPDRSRNHCLLLYWLGFESTEVAFEQPERFRGSSSYRPRDLLKLALDGLFFQAPVLLNWVLYLGVSIVGLAVLLGLATGIDQIAGEALPGWMGFMVLALFLTGLIVSSVGIAATYLGRLFEQARGRPLFVIADSLEGNS